MKKIRQRRKFDALTEALTVTDGMITDDFNPQISQITQITMNARWRLRNLPGLIPRPASVQRDCAMIEIIIH
jgi:hypothetical protein